MRAHRVLLLLAVAFAAAAARGEPGSGVRLLVQSSLLAGFRYHAAAQVIDELRVGDALDLEREADNPHDANAIGVSWHGQRLGYVPRRQNAALAWALDRGETLRARVSRLAPQAAASRRIEFEVYVE